MNKKSSERRQIENEAVFRNMNEQVQVGLDELKYQAEQEGETIQITDTPLHFYCECSDENCQERVVLKPSTYKNIHSDRKQFIIKPNHEVPDIEEVVDVIDDYLVVRKLLTPTEKTPNLQQTNTNNV